MEEVRHKTTINRRFPTKRIINVNHFKIIYLSLVLILSQFISTIGGSSIQTIKDNGEPDEEISSKIQFYADDWSKCSGTCGTGIRTRSVYCKILLDFSKTLSIVPDEECTGDKPIEYEECLLPPCPDSIEDQVEGNYLSGKVGESAALISPSASASASPKVNIYSWKTLGFTGCSATCLGGTQEEIIECVRDHDQMVVNHYLCNIEDKPDSITKTCNDHQCPPRWNISDFGSCSKPCGAGIQTREVNCIHEITRGSENTLIVPDDRCSPPKPVEERVCNVADCPTPTVVVDNQIDKWSDNGKCIGKNCPNKIDKGKRKCNKDSKSGSLSSTSSFGKCTKKSGKCKSGKCKSRVTLDDNNTLEPDKPYIQTLSKKKVSLKVGGTAILYEGTTVKLRCPRLKDENGFLPEVEWTKNGLLLDYDDKIGITRLGSLKIRDIDPSDSGTYTCSHEKTQLSMNIQVVPSRSSSIPISSDNDKESVKYEINRNDLPLKLNGNNDYRIKIKPEPPYEVNQETGKSSLHKLSAYFKNKVETDDSDDNKQSKIHLLHQHLKKSKVNSGMVSNDIGEWTAGRPMDTNETRTAYFADQQSSSHLLNHAKYGSKVDDELRSSGKSHHGSDVKRAKTRLKLWESDLDKSGASLNHVDTFTDGNRKFQASGNSSINDETIYGKTRFQSAEQLADLTESKFEWLVSPWSNCSIPCGGSGVQVRARKCMLKNPNFSKERDDSDCLKNGLDAPEVFKSCFAECPKWKIGQWGECSKCIDFGLGEKTRSVSCTFSDDKIAPSSECGTIKYPETYQFCSNVDCRPMWSTSDWSMCSGVCGMEGSQERSVKCVWLADQSSKAKDCDESKRPVTVRKCNVNCDVQQSDCLNASFLCKYAKPDSCSHPIFRSSCCKSCRDADFITRKR